MTRTATFVAITLVASMTARTAPVPQAPPAAAPGAWHIDPAHSRVSFTVTKWGFVEVEGRFYDFSGSVAYDPARPERSRVDWRVRVASVRTGAANRDEALQQAEYFDAARFPEIRFVSDTVRAGASGQLDVTGRLTIRDVTRPLTVRATPLGTHAVPGEGEFELFHTEFTLDRYDFGVVGGSLLGPAISREVRVTLTLAAQPGPR